MPKGHSRRGIDKSEIEKVYERAKSRCEICFSPKSLTLHHVVTRARCKGWKYRDTRANLALLCRVCHDDVHQKVFLEKKIWLRRLPPSVCPSCDIDIVVNEDFRDFYCPRCRERF